MNICIIFKFSSTLKVGKFVRWGSKKWHGEIIFYIKLKYVGSISKWLKLREIADNISSRIKMENFRKNHRQWNWERWINL